MPKTLFATLTALNNTDVLRTSLVVAVLKKDFETPDYGEHHIIPAGTKVRIWNTSRFGWAGINSDLNKSCSGIEAAVGGNFNARNPGKIEDYFDDFTELTWPA